MSKLTVTEAAKQMEVSAQFLRMALQDKRFSFGAAVKGKGGRWSYYINGERFKEYMKGGRG